MMQGFLAVVNMAFRMFWRDKESLFWGIAFPLIMMGLIGSVFGGTMDLVLSTAVVMEDENPVASGMLHALRSIPTLRVIEEDEAMAVAALRRGDRSLVIVLPGAELDVASIAAGSAGDAHASPEAVPEPFPVRVYFDESNYEVAQAGLAIVNQIVDGVNRSLIPRTDVLQVQASGVTAHQFSMFDFLLPGMLAMVLMQSGLMNVTAVVTSYRERLLLKRVLATPFPPLAFLGGLIARFTVTNVLQGAIIILVGVLVFKAKIVGSYFNIAVLALLGSITFLSMGFAVSVLSKTPDGANAFGSAVSFPMMFLSGTFWPREFIPEVLQPVIKALPLTPLVDALRGVATQADSLSQHTGGILYMLAWAVVSLVVAARRFRWE